MKERRTPDLELETILPILIGYWRRLHKLSGPPDKLQTREFRGVLMGSKHFKSNFTKENLNRSKLLPKQRSIRRISPLSLGDSLPRGDVAIRGTPSPPKRVLDVCAGALPLALLP